MNRWLWALVLAGCQPQPSDPDPSDGTSPTDGTADPTSTPTGSTGATGSTGDTATVPTFDCTTVPEHPVSFKQMDGARGYHDVAFDPLGHIIGSDDNALIVATYTGQSSVFVPGMGVVQGMDWLPDGDLVVAKDRDGSLERVNAAGGTSTLATDVGAYGVIVGPDGMIYTANQRVIHRIDPATGQKTVIGQQNGLRPRVLNFSPDFSQLYIGTYLGNGSLWVVDLDADLNPTSAPRVFAQGVGSGDYHDALGVDICGNLYVPDYTRSALYKITPDGDVTKYADFTIDQYTHGLRWGSGIGGWRDDAIYLPQPYGGNTVVEIVIGVPSRSWTGSASR